METSSPHKARPMKIRTDRPLNIFVKGLNWVGDAIISTPTLTHLRHCYPDAKITLMVRPWVAAVYEHNPDINDLWVHDDAASLGAFLKAVNMVRMGRFSIGVALPNSLRSAMLLYAGNIPYRFGFKRGGRSLLLNRGVAVKDEYLEEHQVFYYLHILEEICGKPSQRAHLVLRPGEVEREEVRRLLAQMGLDRGRPLIGIAPGSINSNAKRWLPERFAALADRLAKETGAEILLLGSGKEKEVLDRVATQCEVVVHNVGGKVNLAQAIALTERLAGLVCNDSGSMHIGAAMRIPTVAVFGPTEFNTTYPFSNLATLVRKDTDCAPCMLRECPIDHRCMTGVEVDEVFEALKKMVKEARKAQKKSQQQTTPS